MLIQLAAVEPKSVLGYRPTVGHKATTFLGSCSAFSTMSQEVKITDADGTRVFRVPERVVSCVQVWKEMLETGQPDANDDTVSLRPGLPNSVGSFR